MPAFSFAPPSSFGQRYPQGTPDHMTSVAFSVAESALKSDPTSPSFGQSMSQIMDLSMGVATCDVQAPADVATFPVVRRKSSFAGRPLWDVVEHAKERREKKSPALAFKPSSFAQDMTIDTIFGGNTSPDDQYQEVIITPSSPDNSPIQCSPLVGIRELQSAMRRLSTDSSTDQRATASTHGRTLSDTQTLPSEVLRSQATTHRPLARLPSLAEIKAKMTTGDSGRRPNGRSDSLDSTDSDGPQTPTEEWNSFDFQVAGAPDTPPSSRLAPFLRERTNGRLARPKSMPPLASGNVFPASPQSPERRQPVRCARQNSLPSTPPCVRRPSAIRSWTTDSASNSSPTSPTESEHSLGSSNFSLPIITCTPADEEDSDEESEGDRIVFPGVCNDSDHEEYVEELEELEEERREREMRGREMLFRLSRRSSETATIRPSIHEREGF